LGVGQIACEDPIPKSLMSEHVNVEHVLVVWLFDREAFGYQFPSHGPIDIRDCWLGWPSGGALVVMIIFDCYHDSTYQEVSCKKTSHPGPLVELR
jgi:hypothetical protein